MSSLEKTASGWRIRWREGGRGSPQQTSERFATKSEAAAAQRIIDARLAARGRVGTLIPWAELVNRWDASHASRTPEYRAASLRTMLRLGETHGWANVTAVQVRQVEGLTGYSGRQLRALLHYAELLGQPVDRRVVLAIKPKAPRRQPQHLLTREQVAELIAMAERWHPADALIVHLVATYGHRCETAIRITWDDLDLEAGTIQLRVKSGDIIAHPLLPETIRRFRDLGTPQGHGPALIGHLGKPWASGRDFAAWWRNSITKAPGSGILDLRRYAITGMLSGGADAKTVASITGHRTPSLLLNVYARTTEERQKAALSAIAPDAGVPTVFPKRGKKGTP